MRASTEWEVQELAKIKNFLKELGVKMKASQMSEYIGEEEDRKIRDHVGDLTVLCNCWKWDIETLYENIYGQLYEYVTKKSYLEFLNNGELLSELWATVDRVESGEPDSIYWAAAAGDWILDKADEPRLTEYLEREKANKQTQVIK